MTAARQIVTLFEAHRGKHLRRLELNLDHRDDVMLRETLEVQVKAVRGTLRVDLSRFWIQVRDVSRHGSPSTVRVKRAGVDKAGRTQVRR